MIIVKNKSAGGGDPMRSHWPIVLLALGLGVLHVVISIRFGPAIASALVGGIGIAYAALNALLGKPKDDPTARLWVSRIFTVSKVTYPAAALVWLSAVGIAAYPIVDRMLSDEFTITVIDEKRQPVDALVEVRLGGETSRVPLEKGIGTFTYRPSAKLRAAQIFVDNKGIVQTIRHVADAEGRFADIVIPVWTGEPPLKVSHFTVSGLAIDALLHGDLPPDLRERYRRVTVINSPVVDSAREFLSMYRNFESSSDYLEYSRTETGTGGGQAMNASAYSEGGDAWLQPYRRRVMKRKFAEQLTTEVEIDFSKDLFGAPVDRPLPDGFLAYFNSEEDWIYGFEAIPDSSTNAWIQSNLRNVAHGPNGAVSLLLERLLTVGDVNQLLKVQANKPDSEFYRFGGPVAGAYLRYMVKHGLPEGLMKAVLHLQAINSECLQSQPHVRLQLPEPEMRFTILQNITDKPVNIESFIFTEQMRDKLQRAGDAAPQRETKNPFDVIAPGETVLVPREFSIKAIYSDEEIAQFRKTTGATVASFRLPPQLPPDVRASSVEGYYGRPQGLKIPASRLLQSKGAFEDIPEGKDFAQKGAAYLVGPSVSEIHYVINGVRIQARSDTRTRLAMVGGMEMGSCPFVFAQYSSAPRPLNLGTIITDQIGIGAKGRDSISVPTGFSRLEVRERENEISYLDSARLLVRRKQRNVYYNARNPQLSRDDGRYAVLRKGDQLILDFGYVPRAEDGEVTLEVNGYYDPVHPSQVRRDPRVSIASARR